MGTRWKPVPPLVSCLLVASGASAQSVGVSLGVADSDYRELASPVALGLTAALPLAAWLGVRADYRRYADRQRWDRPVCEGLIDSADPCPRDLFEGDFRMEVVALGLEVGGPVLGETELGLGLSRAAVWFDGRWTGRETGRSSGGSGEGVEGGWSVVGSVSRPLGSDLLVRLEGRLELPDARVCPLDAYSGFCGTRELRAVDVGVLYRW